MVKLYGTALSPPVRAVFMCADVLGLNLDFVNVNLMEKEHLKDDFLKISPQHTVPVLEDDDGLILNDSHAIMSYLVEKYGKNDSIYPKNNLEQRALINNVLFFDSSLLFGRVLTVSKRLHLDNIQPSQEELDSIKEALQFLEQILTKNNSEYVAGDRLSIADFSIVNSITYANNLVSCKDFPRIQAYVERMQKVPCYKVNEPGLTILKNAFSAKLKV